MDATQERFAYRCLPMLMANQLGWLVGGACSFSARWNGGPLPGDTALCFDSDRHSELVSSLFGHGIITFNMPWKQHIRCRQNQQVRSHQGGGAVALA
jgi:hypothetical protein